MRQTDRIAQKTSISYPTICVEWVGDYFGVSST